MRKEYSPGSSRPAGKLYWPSLPLTTVTVMVAPLFRALTSTHSSASGPAVTFPVRVGPACCAAEEPANKRQTRPAMIQRRDMYVSPDFAYCYLLRAV